MDPLLNEWLNLVVRWVHVVAAIAWIGSSFFFNWLDAALAAPEKPKQGVEGELWIVHSGGFYQVEKIAPTELPRTLHWFKWEAALTWASGMALLALVFYTGSGAYLLDPAGFDDVLGFGLWVAALAAAWLVYDLLWASPLAKTGVVAVAASFLLVLALAFGLSRIMTGHALYLHVGAVLGTFMAGNVWLRIVPAQHQLVRATKSGTAPDATLAANAKLRSKHNNYMTLPVVFLMVSGHYPSAFGHQLNWLVLAALAVVGAALSHYWNLRTRGRSGAWILPAAALALAAIFLAVARS
ncbi:MAG: urate hydroxylase PuuD [Pseudomonadota bacterium]